MFLCMCFHNNSVNHEMTHFQEYIKSFIHFDSDGQTRWCGPAETLETSAADDASVLVFSKQRFHPNQKSDQTASRVLYSLRTKNIPGIVDQAGNPTNMVEKYKLLTCLTMDVFAAAIFLCPPVFVKSQAEDITVLSRTSMTFGRHDASCCRKKPMTVS